MKPRRIWRSSPADRVPPSGCPRIFAAPSAFPHAERWQPCRRPAGCGAVLAGSCSPATLGQIEAMRTSHPTRALDPMKLPAARRRDRRSARLGPQSAFLRVPCSFMPAPRRKRWPRHRRRWDASGPAHWWKMPWPRSPAASSPPASAGWWWPAARPPAPWSRRLGIKALQIGPQIDPGVPATRSLGDPRHGAGSEIR